MRSRLRGWMWPRTGWRRAWRYNLHRVARLPGSAESIAAGLAYGVAVSFTPVPGLHMIVAALLAWALGGSVIAALIGTCLANPWTFPLIWLSTYTIGHWLGFGVIEGERVDFVGTFSALADGVWRGDITLLADRVWPVIEPMLIGGTLLGTCAGAFCYGVLRRIVGRHRQDRTSRLAAGRARAEALRLAAMAGKVEAP